MPMHWRMSWRSDARANALAKRHYTCQSPESDQYVPPGRCLALFSKDRGKAVWVTSWPYAEYVKHAWPGAWVCSIFRNESRVLSSVLIRQAVSATLWYAANGWRELTPEIGMVTFVNPKKVKQKEQMGRCFLEAGFVVADPPTTKGGLLAFQMFPALMPEPRAPIDGQTSLLEFVA